MDNKNAENIENIINDDEIKVEKELVEIIGNIGNISNISNVSNQITTPIESPIKIFTPETKKSNLNNLIQPIPIEQIKQIKQTQINKYYVELEEQKKNQDIQIEKKNLELEYQRRLNQIKEQEDLEQLYFDLENGKRKNDLKKQLGLIGLEDTIKLYPIESYAQSCCSWFNCLSNFNIIENFDKIYGIIINLPSLNNYEKNLILLRFSNILTYCSKKYNRISKLYRLSQIFLIACSIINPALLSINIDRTNPFHNVIFWIVWGLQLAVSLITGYISLFKWDKKNFLFNIYKTKINQEIWFFIGLTGKNYNNEMGNYNHSNYVGLFLNRLEKIYTMLKTTEFEMENSKDTETNGNNLNNPNNLNNIRSYDILQSRIKQ